MPDQRHAGPFLTVAPAAAISMAVARAFWRSARFVAAPSARNHSRNRFDRAGPRTFGAGTERGTKAMFAVIKTGGKQYRVAEDQTLQIEKVAGEPGQIIQLGDVVLLGGAEPQFGTPTVSGASVAAEVLEQGRGPK